MWEDGIHQDGVALRAMGFFHGKLLKLPADLALGCLPDSSPKGWMSNVGRAVITMGSWSRACQHLVLFLLGWLL